MLLMLGCFFSKHTRTKPVLVIEKESSQFIEKILLHSKKSVVNICIEFILISI